MNNETNMILTFSSDIRAVRDSLGVLLKLPELNKFIPKLKINRKNGLKKEHGRRGFRLCEVKEFR